MAVGGRLGTHTQPTLVALSLCLGSSGRQLCVRATCREGCPVGDRGEKGSVIHAGSSRHSQGPLPCASPAHREWMSQSRLIRAFHAKLAQMTDLETARSRSSSIFLKQAHSRAARGLHSPLPRPLIKHLWPLGAGCWGLYSKRRGAGYTAAETCTQNTQAAGKSQKQQYHSISVDHHNPVVNCCNSI